MLQPNPKSLRPHADAKRRAKIVVWLSVVFAVMSLAFAYALYTRAQSPGEAETPTFEP